MKKLLKRWQVFLALLIPVFSLNAKVAQTSLATVITEYDSTDAVLKRGNYYANAMPSNDTVWVQATVKILDQSGVEISHYSKWLILDILHNDQNIFLSEEEVLGLWHGKKDPIVREDYSFRKKEERYKVISGVYPFLKLEKPRYFQEYKLKDKKYVTEKFVITEEKGFFWSYFMSLLLEVILTSFGLVWLIMNFKKEWARIKKIKEWYERLGYKFILIMVLPIISLSYITGFNDVHLIGINQTVHIWTAILLTLSILSFAFFSYKKWGKIFDVKGI
jgi:hypothetical protein